MPYPIPGRCPVCGKEFTASELSCKSCRSTLRGDFALCEFCSLTVEQRALLKSFVAAGGNLKELEAILGVSYPTIKKRLADLAEALGVGGRIDRREAEKVSAERAHILEQLSAGEIGAEEAARRLNELAE